MSLHNRLILVGIAIILVAIVGLVVTTNYYANLPENLSQHETIVLGQNRLYPGSEAALRILVRDTSDAAPLPDSMIRVSMKPAAGGKEFQLFEGRTDELGTANVHFTVPEIEESNYTLLVETESSLGSDKLEQPVTISRDFRILLMTDKPIYQPGQIIHIRALALSTFDLYPAIDQELEFIIADGKGNKVFRQSATTSDYGVASTDFQLATQVNSGTYKISAIMGNTTSEKSVTVEHYILPKFGVELSTEQPYYQPGDHVEGQLDAQYFFGKPVADSQVLLEGFTFDVARNEVFKLEGTTNENGTFAFDFELPNYIAGSDLEGGLGSFYLQASVTDQTSHSESSTLSFPIANSQLIIEAVPESGNFRPGVENILYVLTTYPDGRPAPTKLEINVDSGYKALSAETGQFGLASVSFTPESPWHNITITAREASGASATQEFYFEGEWQEETVLLRPDKPAYNVGDTMELTIFTWPENGTAYLDIIRDGQTISTQALPFEDGQAHISIDTTPDMYGTLELHAYKILRSGTITRDTRLVLVDKADDLDLSFNTDQEIYRPGDTASLDVQVNGQDGEGVLSAVGLAIVDESVFALTQQDPGFAKLYFLLEQELLQPKYDLHGFSIPELITTKPVEDNMLREAQEGAAQASLSAAALMQTGFSVQANSHDEAMRSAYERQQSYFGNLSRGIYGLLLLLPVVIVTMFSLNLWRKRKFWKSLGLVSVFIMLVIILGISGGLETIVEWLTGRGETLLLVLVLTGLASILGLIIYSWRQKDYPLLGAMGLLMLFVVLFVGLIYTVDKSSFYPEDALMLLTLLIFTLLPLAFLLRSAGFGWDKHYLLAFSTFILALFLMIIPLSVVSAGTMPGMALNQRGGPMIADDVIFEGEMMALDAAPMEEEAGLAMEMPAEAEVTTDVDSAIQGQEPPRLRQFFPETMLWLPDGETDANGLLHLDVPVADSITTWRLTALASSQDGRLGSNSGSLQVFQDFFIDLDLPLALTAGDEVAVPVGIFNYLPEAQNIRLDLEEADWFELLDDASKEMTIAANDIDVVTFRIKAQDFGWQPFKVTAWGTQMSDAIQKEVRVFPNGKEIRTSQADRLVTGEMLNQTVTIPAEAIPGTQMLTVKIYPGVVSQVVEGLDSILRMPNGCFEQTSSTTYPNILVLDYLQSSGQLSPEIQFKAEDYINLGYQRLTTFEVNGGGFSLFGNPPSDRMLTAYGLQEFSDLGRVHDVDPGLVDRAARWLLNQQTGDGSWENDTGLVHENTWSNLQNDRLPVTAYIVWSLIEAGYVDDPGTQQGLSYIREFQAQADDPYVLALLSNALVAADLNSGADLQATTQSVLDRLAGLALQEANGAYWQSDVATFIGSEGKTGSIETTALAALAFLKAGSYPDLANAALTSLIQQKDSFGTWYNTQATILALKALIETVRSGSDNVDATVTIKLNAGQSQTIHVTPENFDVVQIVQFADVPLGDNEISIDVNGEGNLMYQLTSSYYLPWDKVASFPDNLPKLDLVNIDVSYDRTELAVDDEVTVDVTVSLNEPSARAEWALIDLGIPPGFSVMTEDLNALVAASLDRTPDSELPTIERFEMTGRQILVYIGKLSYEQPISFSYRLKAKYPLAAQTPASSVYDYYNPDVTGEAQPELIIVNG